MPPPPLPQPPPRGGHIYCQGKNVSSIAYAWPPAPPWPRFWTSCPLLGFRGSGDLKSGRSHPHARAVWGGAGGPLVVVSRSLNLLNSRRRRDLPVSALASRGSLAFKAQPNAKCPLRFPESGPGTTGVWPPGPARRSPPPVAVCVPWIGQVSLRQGRAQTEWTDHINSTL